MKRIVSSLFILAIVSSCSAFKPKKTFNIGTCIEGDYFTFLITGTLSSELYHVIKFYKLKVVGPTNSGYYGATFKERARIVNKAFKKVECPDGV